MNRFFLRWFFFFLNSKTRIYYLSPVQALNCFRFPYYPVYCVCWSHVSNIFLNRFPRLRCLEKIILLFLTNLRKPLLLLLIYYYFLQIRNGLQLQIFLFVFFNFFFFKLAQNYSSINFLLSLFFFYNFSVFPRF